MASEDETTTIISDVLNLAVIDLARVIPSRGSIGVVVVGLRSLRPLCKMKRKGCRRDLLLCDRRQSIESNVAGEVVEEMGIQFRSWLIGAHISSRASHSAVSDQD